MAKATAKLVGMKNLNRQIVRLQEAADDDARTALNRAMSRSYTRLVQSLMNQYSVTRKSLTRLRGKQGQVQKWPAIKGRYREAALWVGSRKGLKPKRGTPPQRLRVKKPNMPDPSAKPYQLGGWWRQRFIQATSSVHQPSEIMLAYMDEVEVARIMRGIIRYQMKTFYPREIKRLLQVSVRRIARHQTRRLLRR